MERLKVRRAFFPLSALTHPLRRFPWANYRARIGRQAVDVLTPQKLADAFGRLRQLGKSSQPIEPK
jgi:hypothetical protein